MTIRTCNTSLKRCNAVAALVSGVGVTLPQALLMGMAPLQYAQFVVLRVGEEDGHEYDEEDWSYEDLMQLVITE